MPIVRLLLLFAVIGGAVFVWTTGQVLPERVTSHFDAVGRANGFMTREVYVWFMLALVAGLPVLVVAVPNALLGLPGLRINLPNGDYWLAPERRAATIDFLRGQSRRFGLLLIGFLCYVHGLVVQANAMQPPHLSSAAMIGGVVAFVAGVLFGLARPIGRFRLRG